MKIKIKYKNKNNIIPIDESIFGDWIDLRASEKVTLYSGDFKLIDLGVAMELPQGYEAIIAPRSSLFKTHGLIVTNSIGIIDNSYCGNNDYWKLPVYATRDTVIDFNERIAQFRLFENQPHIKFNKVNYLSNSNRGGFGSSGRK